MSALGQDPAVSASDDDYELRRARTPVPTFVAESVETHLSRIYAREVKRVGPPRLMGWWADVDGCGTTVDQWMSETVAPLLLVLGQLDLYMDHPPAPDGEPIETKADLQRLGLDRCVASYILPENMLWWRLDPSGQRYLECLVLEHHEERRRADDPLPVLDRRRVDPLRRRRRGPLGRSRTRSASCRSSGSSTAGSRGAGTSASRATRASPSGSGSITTATRS